MFRSFQAHWSPVFMLVLLLLVGAACTGGGQVAPTASPAPAAQATAAAPAAQPTADRGAAAQQAPTAPSRSEGPSQFVIGSLEEPGNLSPLSALPHHFPEHVPMTLMFDSLIQFLPDGKIAPRLAESWEVSSDGRTYTFKLNPRAKWWDGAPVTADDVKFTFEAALRPETQSSTEGLDQIASVEVVDPTTVRVTLKRVTPMFLAQGGSRGIVPRHLLEGQDLAKGEFNRKPVGSGPYRFVSWTPGQSIVMEANRDYFLGAPAIDRVVFKILPDQNVVLTQLRAGEIQYALITPRDLAAVEKLPGIKLYENPTPRFFDISPNYDRPYFSDVRVRQALLYGINRQGIVDKVLLGHGKVIESNVSPVSWAYNDKLPRRDYDPDRARQLLSEAGWQPGPDGVRQKDGQRLAFTVLINSFDRTLEQALIVAQQDLKQIGVEMSLERVEPGVFNDRRTKKNFDALARIWNPVYDPDQASLIRTGNFYGYSNPEVDRLVDAELSTLDQTARKEAFLKLQEVLANDVARLWLYSENELHVLPARVTGVQLHPVNIFWNMREWRLQ